MHFHKKDVLHTTPLMHCKAKQVSPDLFSVNQGNLEFGISHMEFAAGTFEINLKNLNM